MASAVAVSVTALTCLPGGCRRVCTGEQLAHRVQDRRKRARKGRSYRRLAGGLAPRKSDGAPRKSEDAIAGLGPLLGA
eukprot:172761-Rhodomonas_salina.1